MRETLSLLCGYHWKKSFWDGNYIRLSKLWGWKCIFTDTWNDIKRKAGKE